VGFVLCGKIGNSTTPSGWKYFGNVAQDGARRLAYLGVTSSTLSGRSVWFGVLAVKSIRVDPSRRAVSVFICGHIFFALFVLFCGK
jgi:hypothetical protein